MGFLRQRRRDYAVLKALGAARGQIRSTVQWLSGAVLGVARIAARRPDRCAPGRYRRRPLVWIVFAEDRGIVARPVIPVSLLGMATVVTVLVVQGTALVPAAIARRTLTRPHSPRRVTHADPRGCGKPHSARVGPGWARRRRGARIAG